MTVPAKLLAEAVAVARRVGFALVATADGARVPHVAAVGKLTQAGEELIAVDEWFCPGTIGNLAEEGAAVSIVAWDPATDKGYQLLGQMEALLEESLLDGYMPEHADDRPPQVEWRLVVRVTRVLDFTKAPHSDEEAGSRE